MKTAVQVFEPLADRILLELEPPEDVTAGGIILPETAKEMPQVGRVKAIGPGKTHHTRDEPYITPVSVKIGDRVSVGKYAGVEISVNGVLHKVVTEEDVLGVFKVRDADR